MTDQEIFDVARVARVADKSDTVESVPRWRSDARHPVTKLLRIRFGVDICDSPQVIYPQAKFGIVHTVFNAIGGTETWARNFVRYVGDVSGVATLDRPSGEIDTAIYHGDIAVRTLCQAADTVLVWGITDVHKHLFESPRPRRLLAMHHGALNSRWACEVFENQLRWCDGGVAVSRDVAKHYGATWIPNMVPESTLPARERSADKLVNTVLWLHRPSGEKQPELALQIAEQLPSNWRMIGTFGNMTVPDCVENLGVVTDPFQKKNLYETSDVFLATPIDEGFGYSVAEAIERLLPVVSTPQGIAERLGVLTLSSNALLSDWVSAITSSIDAPLAEFRRNVLLQDHGACVVAEKWSQL